MIDIGDHDQQLAAQILRHDPLPINAFGALPQQASKLPGLGGTFPPDDPAYVFKTLPIRPALGRVTFTVALIGLRATRGTLVIRITSTLMVAEALPVPVKTVPILLTELAAKFGIMEIEVDSKRNVFYGLTGHIFDETDATAEGIAVSLDRREESETERVRPTEDELISLLDAPAPKIRARPEMISVAPPVLAWPASQVMTGAQFLEAAFAECITSLSRPVEPNARNWIDAYIMQVLRHLVTSTPGNKALAIGATGTDIPEYLAGRGWEISLATAPVRALDHAEPALPSIEHASTLAIKPVGEVDLLSMQGRFEGLDFLWSVGVADSEHGHSAFPKFLAESIICLKPGGVALHVIDYSGTLDPVRGPRSAPYAYARSEIERMALATISHGQEVAQLKFALGPDDQAAAGKSLPFGIIARRQW